MRVVFKYAIAKFGSTAIRVPKDSVLRSVQNQRGTLVVWMEHEANQSSQRNYVDGKTVVFTCRETGEKFEPLDGEIYLATVQFDGGMYIIHVYQQI